MTTRATQSNLLPKLAAVALLLAAVAAVLVVVLVGPTKGPTPPPASGPQRGDDGDSDDGDGAGQRPDSTGTDGTGSRNASSTTGTPASGSGQAAPTDRDSGAIAGRVLDVDGAAVPGLTLRVEPLPPNPGEPLQVVGDDAGAFRVSPLAAGAYRVTLAAQHGWLRAEKVVSVADAVTSLDLVTTRGVDCEFHLLVEGGGVPPDGTRVTLTRDRHAPPGPGLRSRTATADAATGRARLDDVAPGAWTVAVSGPLPAHRTTVTVPTAASLTTERFTVTIVLAEGAAVAGVVTDATGRPLPGVTVRCAPLNTRDGDPAAGGRTTRSGDDGRYLVRGLDTGSHLLTASLAPWRGYSREIEVGDGRTTHDITLDGGLELTGTVQTPDGRPVADGRVELMAPPRGPYESRPTADIEAGTFAMSGLTEGRFEVHVTCPGFAAPPGLTVAIAGPDTHLDIRLLPATTLAGVVRNAATDAPVPGARVLLWLLDAAAGITTPPVTGYATTAADGSFSVPDLPAGEYLLAVQAHGHAPFETSLTVSGDSATRDVALPFGLRIAGHVRYRNESIPRAFVRVARPDSGQVATPTGGTGDVQPDDGRFRITGLAAGTYELWVVDKTSGLTLHRRTLLLESDTEGVDIVATPPTTRAVQGRVTQPDGSPAAGIELRLTADAGDARRFEARTLTDADGAFGFDRVPPGRWRIRGRDASGRQVLPGWSVEVVEDEPAPTLALRIDDIVRGVRLTHVDADSTAARAGLAPGDFITAYDGTPVATADELAAAVRLAAHGHGEGMIEIDYRRDGRDYSGYVTRGALGVRVR